MGNQLELFEMSLPERLNRYTKTDEGCWEWTGSRNDRGYGRVRMPGQPHQLLAHRLIFEVLIGPIAESLTVDHLCRNRACVNPGHLEAVPLKVNILRGVGWGAVNARKTHCDHGHELNEENTYRRPDGRRECRPCNREQARRYRRKGGAVATTP